MLFDTPIYLVFLTLCVVLYWTLKHKSQNVFLLGCSYIFYGWWDWRFLLLMIGSTTIDYLVGRGIEDESSSAARKRLLILSLVVNFTILGFFKYFNFFLDSTVSSLGAFGIRGIPRSFLSIILPPGISFYTFQEVAYIVDVYSGRVKASRKFVDYALFISLFPHLIAGPIQRPSHLLPQVQRPRFFDSERFRDGCMLILMGLFRKCVLADNFANLANSAFGGTLGRNGWTTLIGVYAFAGQIYGDFSGYSDIARGSAKLLGFEFMVNFRQPYLATSMQDFWRRWHISLSTWLRDYLYIPLGGSRHGSIKTYRNLLVTMLLGGLWHGANWTFVIWGALHGVALSIERLVFGDHKPGADSPAYSKVFRRILCFHFVCFAWIFFRAETLSAAVAMIRSLAHFQWSPSYMPALLFLAVLSGVALAIDLLVEHSGKEYLFQGQRATLSLAWVVSEMVLLAFFSGSGSHAFIYFQF